MKPSKETFGMWMARKRLSRSIPLSQKELAQRASKYVPTSAVYISTIERNAGTGAEPQVSTARIVAISHALGENPKTALALRVNAISEIEPLASIEIPLSCGGLVIVNTRRVVNLDNAQKAQLTAVVSALLCMPSLSA